ncbi:unnamed protein product [Rotaria magnacalcarata]|nr:unnamed protein product [Rotaria magnacalcarata]
MFNKFSSFEPNNQQESEHICLIDCTFTIPFDAPLVVPSTCREQLTTNICQMSVIVGYTQQLLFFFSLNSTLSLTVNGARFDTVSGQVFGFQFMDNILSCMVLHACSNGDKCEWNYLIGKIQSLIKSDYQPLYNSLSLKLYGEQSESTVSHCYSSNELTECSGGKCFFVEGVNQETFASVKNSSCLFDEMPMLHFGTNRYTPGPTKYDFDFLIFTCNLNECNSPTNELTIKRLVGFNESKSLGLIETGCLYLVIGLYFIISISIKLV